jgi:predicted SprT family Zn-dependent metalloprotease
MKDVYRLLEQKEADLARLRREIEGLQFIASMDCTTRAVQQELATWICCKCNRQYSRRAAESVDWSCEDCEVALLDASGQQFEAKKRRNLLPQTDKKQRERKMA